jgi:hypothetical protein
VKNQIMPSCSSGSKKLTECEWKMLDSYSRLMEKMCHECWPVEYAEFRKRIKGKSWKDFLPFKESKDIDQNTMRLIFVLTTDFALRQAIQENKRCPYGGYFGTPGRFMDNPRWRLPSPFYACRHIRKKIQYSSAKSKQQVSRSGRLIASGKAGWIAQRKAVVMVSTLHHEDIPIGSDAEPVSSLKSLQQSMSRLQERFDSIRGVIAHEWLVGGFAGWDVAPKRRGGKLVLNLHLHILGEPYEIDGEIVDCVPREVAAAWGKSKKTETEVSGTSESNRTAQHSDDTLVQLLYVAGVAKVGAEDDYSFYPKFIRGFDRDQVGKKNYKTSEKSQRPTMRQLHMIHGLYMAQPESMLGFFGGWDHRTRVGRELRNLDGKHSSEMRQNDLALREFI